MGESDGSASGPISPFTIPSRSTAIRKARRTRGSSTGGRFTLKAIQPGRTCAAVCTRTPRALSTRSRWSAEILVRPALPFSISVSRPVGSGTTRTTMRSSAGRPSGASGLASTVSCWPFCQLTKRKRPLPTGCSLKSAKRSLSAGTVSRMCLGTGTTSRSALSDAGPTRENFTSTVMLSTARAVRTAATSPARVEAVSSAPCRSMVKTTSPAVTGRPSCQFTPGRRWRMAVLSSGCSQLSSRSGS